MRLRWCRNGLRLIEVHYRKFGIRKSSKKVRNPRGFRRAVKETYIGMGGEKLVSHSDTNQFTRISPHVVLC